MKESIARVEQAWRGTLEHFGIDPVPMSRHETKQIIGALKEEDVENIVLAIEGARYEQGFKSNGREFNPVDYLSIKRILHEDRFDRFRLLGMKARTKKRKLEEAKQREQSYLREESDERISPEKIVEIKRKLQRGGF